MYLGDIKDAYDRMSKQDTILSEITRHGYEYAFERYGALRRKDDYFMRQFEKATRTEISAARSIIYKRQKQLREIWRILDPTLKG